MIDYRIELRSLQGVIDLTEWSLPSGWTALASLEGFGLPAATPQWWEGAGDGKHYRGSRIESREVRLPLILTGKDRPAMQAALDQLARALDPHSFDRDSMPLLRVTETNGYAWDLPVVRRGAVDWPRGLMAGIAHRRSARLTLDLEAGDPYFTRVAPATAVVGANRGRGLLGPPDTSLSQLRLSASGTSAFGTVTLDNPGSAPAYPVVTVTGPADGLDLQSQGVGLTWSGTLTAGESLTLDHQAGTIVDDTGSNRYGELGPAPRFWRVPPGRTTATVAITGIDPAVSQAELSWRPRRWLVY